jgi:hypothetical protein
MIDTINIHIKESQLPIDFYQQAFLKFKTKRTTRNEDSGQIWGTCTFQNFVCTFNAYGITMSGSISRYFYGTNQYNIDRFDFEKAIERLSQELNVELKNCRVGRIDLAENIITQQPVENYYKYFGEVQGLNRKILRNGLLYTNTVSSITIYNKMKELKNTKTTPISIFDGKNVLRFEYRALKPNKVGSIFGAKKVNVIDVINNYDLLIDVWLKKFNNIFKNHDLMIFESSAFSDSKGFEKQLILAGIEVLGGGQYILETIKEARKAKLFKAHKNTATNLTRKIKSVLQTPVLTKKSTLMVELEKKVEVIRFVISNKHTGETLA